MIYLIIFSRNFSKLNVIFNILDCAIIKKETTIVNVMNVFCVCGFCLGKEKKMT